MGSNRMCSLKPSDWDKDKDSIRSRVRNAEYVCAKCFRASNDKDRLCKPKKIK